MAKKYLPIAGAASAPKAASEAPKRRLPMLPKVEVEGGSDEDRPPWHWSAIGAVGVFLAWLPMATIVNGPLLDLFGGAKSAKITLNLAAFLLGSFAGGYLVGRFGGRAGVKEATLSGIAATMIAWVLAVTGARASLLVWVTLLTVLVTLAAGSARLGGRVGLRGRKP